jgi:hypothetical protein
MHLPIFVARSTRREVMTMLAEVQCMTAAADRQTRTHQKNFRDR